MRNTLARCTCKLLITETWLRICSLATHINRFYSRLQALSISRGGVLQLHRFRTRQGSEETQDARPVMLADLPLRTFAGELGVKASMRAGEGHTLAR